jgi:phosphatidylglycerophosphatase A
LDRRLPIARAVSTVGGLGDLLPAPGTTAGSLPATLLWWGFAALVPDPGARLCATLVAAAIAIVAGVWAAGAEAARRGRNDPGPVVIDEVAGQWVCLAAILCCARPTGGWQTTAIAAAGFFGFRILDVIKPWPIRRLEKIHGGVGIVADDVAAGLAAGIIVAAAWVWLGMGSRLP